jgi:hypothetical protein
MFLLRDLIKNFYPTQSLYIHIMNGDSLHMTPEYLEVSNNICLDFYVRTIEIYRDEMGKLKDIITVIVSKN